MGRQTSVFKKHSLLFSLLVDLVCVCLISGCFAAYYVFLPKKATPKRNLSVSEFASFFLPVDPYGDGMREELISLANASKLADNTRKVLEVYADNEKELVISRCEEKSENGTIVYFVCDLWFADIRVFRTHVSTDEDGKIDNRSVAKQAKTSGALLCMTGDTFGVSFDGMIVRNGLLYRDDVNSENDICLICADGSMKIYEHTDGYTLDEIEKLGVWQAFTFGPSLLDRNGNPKKNFNIAASHLSDLSSAHPRTAVGMAEPGHFILVTVDGRGMNGSVGATFPELSAIMKNEGCKAAYNLDGGRSSVMIYDGKTVNEPYKNGRPISDVICIPKDPVIENAKGAENDDE